MNSLIVTIAGYVGLIAMTGLYLDKRDDLAKEIEACNTRTERSVAEASEKARQAEREASDAEIARLAAIADSQSKARQIVADALRESEAKDPIVREVVKNVPRDQLAAQCLDLPVVPAVFGSVRP